MKSHIVLRPHQEEQRKAVMKLYSEGKRNQVIVHPTGSGKAISIVELVESFQKENGGIAVVVSPFTTTNTQLMNTFRNVSHTRVAPLNNNRSIFTEKVFIGTIQSTIQDSFERIASRSLHTKFNLLIIDEGHLGDEWYDSIKSYLTEDALVVSYTATPWRKNQWGFPNSTLAHSVSLSDMISAGYLVEPRLKQIKRSGPEQKDIHKDAVGIVQKDLAEYDQPLAVFVRSKEEAMELTSLMVATGIKADYITSDMNAAQRKIILDRFHEGKTKVMVNISVLATGYDFPALAGVLLLYGSSSVNSYQQRIGRALRSHPTKDHARIYAFGDAPTIESGVYKRELKAALELKPDEPRPEGLMQDLAKLESQEDVDLTKLTYTRELVNQAKLLREKGHSTLAQLIINKKFPKQLLKDPKEILERINGNKHIADKGKINDGLIRSLVRLGFDIDSAKKLNKVEAQQVLMGVQSYNERHGDYAVPAGPHRGKHISEVPDAYIGNMKNRGTRMYLMNMKRRWKDELNSRAM